MAYFKLEIVLFTISLCNMCIGHIICKDFTYPIIPSPPHDFCSMYNGGEGSCCTNSLDQQIEIDYDLEIADANATSCELFIKNISCATCGKQKKIS
jgi:hypothetical protein